MSLEISKIKDASPTVLRLPPELKEELAKRALENDRSLSKEITIRLKVSLAARGPTLQGILAREADAKNGTGIAPVPTTAPDDPWAKAGEKLHPTESAMLQVFRALPADKQLALLTLFK